MKFSINLKELLQEHNLSQAKLADSIGFSQRAVSKWVNAQAEPTETAIIACANFFNISTDELLGTSENIEKITSTKKNTLALSASEQELLEIFNSLEAEHRAQILEYARYFAQRAHPQTYKRNKNA